MQRGQAFETIMMVIAVIVALAILGFLTGILGNLSSMFNPSDPGKTMTSALQGIAGSYSSGTAPQVLSFNVAGQSFDTAGLTQSTSLSSYNVYFVCSSTVPKGAISISSLGSGSTALQKMTINQKVSLEMVACGNPSLNGKGPYYVIALGGNGDTAGTSNACYNAFTNNPTFGTAPTSNCQ